MKMNGKAFTPFELELITRFKLLLYSMIRTLSHDNMLSVLNVIF